MQIRDIQNVSYMIYITVFVAIITIMFKKNLNVDSNYDLETTNSLIDNYKIKLHCLSVMYTLTYKGFISAIKNI